MCWNKEVSILALVFGSITNILLYQYAGNDRYLKTIAILWQFAISMQFFEALSWKSLETGSRKLGNFATYGAYVFNVLQPIVAVAILWRLATEDHPAKKWALALSAIYIVVMIHQFPYPPKDMYMEGCENLQLYWWRRVYTYAVPLYLAIMALACTMIKPLSLGMSQYAYMIVTLIISNQIYQCGTASVWCFFVVLAPLYTILVDKLIR